jgi:hypothetical protein
VKYSEKTIVSLLLSLIASTKLFTASISIEFSNDFIATMTQKPWSTVPQYYSKPLQPSNKTDNTSNSLIFFTTTLRRLNLCAAGYLLITRFLAIRTKCTIGSTYWLDPFGALKKAMHYSWFVMITAAVVSEVVLVHLCMKYVENLAALNHGFLKKL